MMREESMWSPNRRSKAPVLPMVRVMKSGRNRMLASPDAGVVVVMLK
jgi:hypothetical protein